RGPTRPAPGRRLRKRGAGSPAVRPPEDTGTLSAREQRGNASWGTPGTGILRRFDHENRLQGAGANRRSNVEEGLNEAGGICQASGRRRQGTRSGGRGGGPEAASS